MQMGNGGREWQRHEAPWCGREGARAPFSHRVDFRGKDERRGEMCMSDSRFIKERWADKIELGCKRMENNLT